VPPPGAAIDEPIGVVIEPCGEAGAGCVVEPIGAGAVDVPPHAVGCALVVSEPPASSFDPALLEFDPASLEPASDPVVAAVGCAWPALAEDEALAEGGGTVRSLWQ
jgi:hypothetical protein